MPRTKGGETYIPKKGKRPAAIAHDDGTTTTLAPPSQGTYVPPTGSGYVPRPSSSGSSYTPGTKASGTARTNTGSVRAAIRKRRAANRSTYSGKASLPSAVTSMVGKSGTATAQSKVKPELKPNATTGLPEKKRKASVDALQRGVGTKPLPKVETRRVQKEQWKAYVEGSTDARHSALFEKAYPKWKDKQRQLGIIGAVSYKAEKDSGKPAAINSPYRNAPDFDALEARERKVAKQVKQRKKATEQAVDKLDRMAPNGRTLRPGVTPSQFKNQAKKVERRYESYQDAAKRANRIGRKQQAAVDQYADIAEGLARKQQPLTIDEQQQILDAQNASVMNLTGLPGVGRFGKALAEDIADDVIKNPAKALTPLDTVGRSTVETAKENPADALDTLGWAAMFGAGRGIARVGSRFAKGAAAARAGAEGEKLGRIAAAGRYASGAPNAGRTENLIAKLSTPEMQAKLKTARGVAAGTTAGAIGADAALGDLTNNKVGGYTVPFAEGTFKAVTERPGDTALSSAQTLLSAVAAPFAIAGNVGLSARRAAGALDEDATPYEKSGDYILSPVERLADETWTEAKDMFETVTSRDVEQVKDMTAEQYGVIPALGAFWITRPIFKGAYKGAAKALGRGLEGSHIKGLEGLPAAYRNRKMSTEATRAAGRATGLGEAVTNLPEPTVRQMAKLHSGIKKTSIGRAAQSVIDSDNDRAKKYRPGDKNEEVSINDLIVLREMGIADLDRSGLRAIADTLNDADPHSFGARQMNLLLHPDVQRFFNAPKSSLIGKRLDNIRSTIRAADDARDSAYRDMLREQGRMDELAAIEELAPHQAIIWHGLMRGVDPDKIIGRPSVTLAKLVKQEAEIRASMKNTVGRRREVAKAKRADATKGRSELAPLVKEEKTRQRQQKQADRIETRAEEAAQRARENKAVVTVRTRNLDEIDAKIAAAPNKADKAKLQKERKKVKRQLEKAQDLAIRENIRAAERRKAAKGLRRGENPRLSKVEEKVARLEAIEGSANTALANAIRATEDYRRQTSDAPTKAQKEAEQAKIAEEVDGKPIDPKEVEALRNTVANDAAVVARLQQDLETATGLRARGIRKRLAQAEDQKARNLGQLRRIENQQIARLSGDRLRAALAQVRINNRNERLRPKLEELRSVFDQAAREAYDANLEAGIFLAQKAATEVSPSASPKWTPMFGSPKEHQRTGALLKAGKVDTSFKAWLDTYERVGQRVANTRTTQYIEANGLWRQKFSDERTPRTEFTEPQIQQLIDDGKLEQKGGYLIDTDTGKKLARLDTRFLTDPETMGSQIIRREADKKRGVAGIIEDAENDLPTATDRVAERLGQEGQGRKYALVDTKLIETMRGIEADLGKVGNFLQWTNRISSKMVLGFSPSWAFAQPIAEMLILIADHPNPARLIRALKEVKKIHDGPDTAAKRGLSMLAGNSVGVHRSIRNSRKFHEDVEAGLKASEQTYARMLMGEFARAEWPLGKFDRWKGAWIREMGVMAELDRELSTVRQVSKAVMGQLDEIQNASAKLKTMTPDEQIAWVSSKEGLAVGERLRKNIDASLGNWIDLKPGMERTLGSPIFFYPFIRFSINWTLRTFPKRHPGRWAATSMYGGFQKESLERLMEYDPTWMNEWAVAPIYGSPEGPPTAFIPLNRYAIAGNAITELGFQEGYFFLNMLKVLNPLLSIPIRVGVARLDAFGRPLTDANDTYGQADAGLATVAGQMGDELLKLVAPIREAMRLSDFSIKENMEDGWTPPWEWESGDYRRPPGGDPNALRDLFRRMAFAGLPIPAQLYAEEQNIAKMYDKRDEASQMEERAYEFNGEEEIMYQGEKRRLEEIRDIIKGREDDYKDKKKDYESDTGLVYPGKKPTRTKREQEIMDTWLDIHNERAYGRGRKKEAEYGIYNYSKDRGLELDKESSVRGRVEEDKREARNKVKEERKSTREKWLSENPGLTYPGYAAAKKQLPKNDEDDPNLAPASSRAPLSSGGYNYDATRPDYKLKTKIVTYKDQPANTPKSERIPAGTGIEPKKNVPRKRQVAFAKKIRAQKVKAFASGAPTKVPKKYAAAVAKWGSYLEGRMKANGLVAGSYEEALQNGTLPPNMSGAEYLARILQAESGWDDRIGHPDNTSSAQAQGLGQFIPSTRDAFADQFGVDAYGSPEEQIKAAAYHLDGDHTAGGLQSYNPGFPEDSDGTWSYYLDQDVGKPTARNNKKAKEKFWDMVAQGKRMGVYEVPEGGATNPAATGNYSPGGQGTSSTEWFAPDENTLLRFQPPLARALLQLAKASGEPLQFNSGFRTRAEQEAAYADYQAGGNLAAVPGTSNHEFGRAADISLTDKQRELLPQFGLGLPVPGEDWHVELVGEAANAYTDGMPKAKPLSPMQQVKAAERAAAAAASTSGGGSGYGSVVASSGGGANVGQSPSGTRYENLKRFRDENGRPLAWGKGEDLDLPSAAESIAAASQDGYDSVESVGEIMARLPKYKKISKR